jgi:hypothetical protein
VVKIETIRKVYAGASLNLDSKVDFLKEQKVKVMFGLLK